MPNPESQETDGDSSGLGGEKPQNKCDAVFRVLQGMGHDTKPKQIQRALKDNWNIVMDTKAISTTKHHVLKGAGSKSRLIRRRPGRPPSSGQRSMGGSGISLQDLEAVKTLADRLGAETVRRVAEMLVK